MAVRISDHDGFTLFETLVALLLASGIATGVAALVMLASRVTDSAREQTLTVILAADKLEVLRVAAGKGLVVHGGSLVADEPGYADFLDRQGRPVASADAVFVRRWEISAGADPRLTKVRVMTTTRALDVRRTSRSSSDPRGVAETLLVAAIERVGS